jgi:hypothetical protein
MAEADQPAHPRRFDVFRGGCGQPNYQVVWDGDVLHYYMSDFAPPQERGEPTEIVKPSEHQWRRFWHEMEAVELWAWQPSYHARGIMDGTQWDVEIERGARAVSARGSNRYPAHSEERAEDGHRTERFERFAQAIRELLGDRSFD